MSTQAAPSAVLSSVQGNKTGIDSVERPVVDFPSSVWGDFFCKYDDDDFPNELRIECERKISELKEDVRRMMTVDLDKPLETLDVINQVQRLGIEYLFENEIGKALEQIHKIYFECTDPKIEGGLSTVALLFRLLRQEGYRISSDIFSRFKDEKGSFMESLVSDVQGLLSLYEASHMMIHGEDILEDALAFTYAHLKASCENNLIVAPLLEALVNHALKQSIRKGVPRMEARWYLDIYQQDPFHNHNLLTLAKLDFNLLQKLHQKELGEIARWWKGLDFETKLPFARDRHVECYFWIWGAYFEPQYSFGRKMLSKILILISVIDDVYDAYGTFDELELFTEAIRSWNRGADDSLPYYMQVLFKALLDLYDSIEKKLSDQGNSHFLHYAKESMKSLIIEGYMEEAKWLQQRRNPSFVEYMSVALTSSAYDAMATTAFVGMGDIVTKDVLEWSRSNPRPRIIKASQITLRLSDDIQSHKFEQEREHIWSAVECYMKDYNVTEQEAKEALSKQLSNAWKDINEECLCPTIYPMCILLRVVNLARVNDFMYKGEDHYTNAHLVFKDVIRSLYIDQVEI